MTKKETIVLAKVHGGTTVRFVSVDAGHGLRQRLAAMGMLPGVEMEVVRNSHKGQVILTVKGTRIVLGRGMSSKIVVAKI